MIRRRQRVRLDTHRVREVRHTGALRGAFKAVATRQ